MTFFKINGVDFSKYVSSLVIDKKKVYNTQTNAAGNTVADYINTKREIEVGIIPLDDTVMAQLQNEIDALNVSISFRNPKTNTLEENVNCIIPQDGVDYYTLSGQGRMYKAFTLKFSEL